MVAQGAFGTDFYDRSILRPKHYYHSGRPVIKIWHFFSLCVNSWTAWCLTNEIQLFLECHELEDVFVHYQGGYLVPLHRGATCFSSSAWNLAVYLTVFYLNCPLSLRQVFFYSASIWVMILTVLSICDKNSSRRKQTFVWQIQPNLIVPDLNACRLFEAYIHQVHI